MKSTSVGNIDKLTVMQILKGQNTLYDSSYMIYQTFLLY